MNSTMFATILLVSFIFYSSNIGFGHFGMVQGYGSPFGGVPFIGGVFGGIENRGGRSSSEAVEGLAKNDDLI